MVTFTGGIQRGSSPTIPVAASAPQRPVAGFLAAGESRQRPRCLETQCGPSGGLRVPMNGRSRRPIVGTMRADHESVPLPCTRDVGRPDVSGVDKTHAAVPVDVALCRRTDGSVSGGKNGELTMEQTARALNAIVRCWHARRRGGLIPHTASVIVYHQVRNRAAKRSRQLSSKGRE